MAAELHRLPGVGQKTAMRFAYHIASMPLEDVRSLSVALWEGRKAIRFCTVCGNYAAGDLCSVCADPERHNGQICVVRDPRDVAALERTHEYAGLYHVLHGTSPPIRMWRGKPLLPILPASSAPWRSAAPGSPTVFPSAATWSTRTRLPFSKPWKAAVKCRDRHMPLRGINAAKDFVA